MSTQRKLRDLSTKLILASLALILVVGLFGYVSQMAIAQTLPQVPKNVSNVLISVVLILTSLAVVHGASIILDKIGESADKFTKHQKEISYRFIQITVYLSSSILIISSVWNIDLSNVLLGAGVLGVLIGLSARQGLSAVISGIIIMATNMFRVGDWVKFEDKFGRISKITFFNTHFRSPQGEQHVIPNNSITAQNVTNISQGKFRNDLLVSIDYEADIDEAIDVCDSVLSRLKDKETSQYQAIVGFQPTSVKEFDDSSIVLAIKVWIDTPTPTIINQSQTVVFTELKKAFDDEDIEIPFPQMTLSERNE